MNWFRIKTASALLFLVTVVLTAYGAPGSQGTAPAADSILPAIATYVPGLKPALNPARLSNLMHVAVLDQAGGQIGVARDMIMDLDTSSIKYVIVSTGGIPNAAARNIAVPWAALQLQANADNSSSARSFFKLLVDENLLLNAPIVRLEQDLPRVGQPATDWDKEIRAYWNLLPDSSSLATSTDQSVTPEGVPLKGILLASHALGFNFKLQGEENLAVSIDDVIVNIQTGKILYVAIHTNFENAREQWVPGRASILNNMA